MADQKITQLTEDTSPSATDLVVTVKDPSGTPTNKKVQIQNLLPATNFVQEHNTDGTHKVVTLTQQSSTPPNPASGKVKIYTGDGSTDPANLPVLLPSTGTKHYLELMGNLYRNAIINGNFDIWQRGTSYPAIPHFGKIADRWVWGIDADTAVFKNEQSTDVPNNASVYSYKISCTTADTSIGSAEQAHLRYAIEGYDIAKLINKTVTLSFYVKSNLTGTYCVAFIVNDIKTYVAEYTINNSNTWERKSITLTLNPSDVTWNTTNGQGIKIRFVLYAGSVFHTTPNSWNNGNLMATSNQVNFASSTSNVFYLSQVQLNVGEIALPFYPRPYTEELRLCKRYYERITKSVTSSPYGTGVCLSSTSGQAVVPFEVEKRGNPTITFSSPSTNFEIRDSGGTRTVSSFSTPIVDTKHIYVLFNSSSLTTGNGCIFRNGTNVTTYIEADAEL
jgi:hypothetical protein